MHINEPMTMATDYLLAVVIFVMGATLARSDSRYRHWWALTFFTTGIAAIVGGTWHGFKDMIPADVMTSVGKVTLIAVGLASVGMWNAASHAAFQSTPWHRRFQILGWLKFAVLCAWLTTHSNFSSVIFDYVPTMLFALVIMIILWRRDVAGCGSLVTGILLSFAAAGVQMSGIAIHRHFNHNDLYHIVQLIAFVVMWRGILAYPR
jgi:hypothetical protein